MLREPTTLNSSLMKMYTHPQELYVYASQEEIFIEIEKGTEKERLYTRTYDFSNRKGSIAKVEEKLKEAIKFGKEKADGHTGPILTEELIEKIVTRLMWKSEVRTKEFTI